MVSSLLTLPVELVYRILDNLNDKTMFLSLSNVCIRLNSIINTYHRYQVNFSFILEVYLRKIVHFEANSDILPSPPLFSLMLDLIRKSPS